MSIAIGTLYSVDYGYPSQYDTIVDTELWAAYDLFLTTPSSSGGRQNPMTVQNYAYASTPITPTTSGTPLSVYPIAMIDTSSYLNGTYYGSIVSDFSAANFPYMSGYYWDDGTSSYINTNADHPNSYSFEFWNPNTQSYHEVSVGWKLRDEHDVVAHWDATSGTPSKTHTYSGCQYYGKVPVKTNDLYLTFLDGSSTNRYICDNYLDYRRDTSSGFYSEGYFDQFNPYCSVIAYLRTYVPSWSQYSEGWSYMVTGASGAAKAYPVITNIHKNLDDPNGNWVGTLTFAVNNRPLWILGSGTQPINDQWFRQLRQVKGSFVWDETFPRDELTEGIFIPESYGPFGNWLVKLQPTGLLAMVNGATYPIQQRIFTITKRTGIALPTSAPYPDIPNT